MLNLLFITVHSEKKVVINEKFFITLYPMFGDVRPKKIDHRTCLTHFSKTNIGHVRPKSISKGHFVRPIKYRYFRPCDQNFKQKYYGIHIVRTLVTKI